MADEIPTDADLIDRINAFCERQQMPPTTFGRLAVGDGSLIPNLRSGRSPTLKLANRLVAFMAEYRPTTEARAA